VEDTEMLRMTDRRDEGASAPPAAPLLSAAELAALASKQLDRQVELAALQLGLSARHPYDAAGLLDFYRPGRWDCTDDYVSMTSDFAGDATFGYGQFKAKSAGSHLVALHVNGYQTTVRLNGPWGTVTAYCAANTDPPSVATALWTAPAAGSGLSFSFSFTGGIVGYLRKVEIHTL